MPDKTEIDVDIYDTAASEGYRELMKFRYYYPKYFFFVVYAINDRRTLEYACELLFDIRRSIENGFNFLLVGNKCDLDDRQVSSEEGSEVADEFGGIFIETSAKESINVNESFQLATMMYFRVPKPIERCCSI